LQRTAREPARKLRREIERDIAIIPFTDAEELRSNKQSYCKHDLERKIAIAIDRLFCVILNRHAVSRAACLPGRKAKRTMFQRVPFLHTMVVTAKASHFLGPG
jgi:hypothetical protein